MPRETYSDDEIYWDVMTAVGWIDDAGNPIDNDGVEDRFNTRYLVRAASDGSEFPHDYTRRKGNERDKGREARRRLAVRGAGQQILRSLVQLISPYIPW